MAKSRRHVRRFRRRGGTCHVVKTAGLDLVISLRYSSHRRVSRISSGRASMPVRSGKRFADGDDVVGVSRRRVRLVLLGRGHVIALNGRRHNVGPAGDDCVVRAGGSTVHLAADSSADRAGKLN